MSLLWLIVRKTLFFLSLIGLLIASLWFLFQAFTGVFRSTEIQVPDFVGRSIAYVLENQPQGIDIEILEKKPSAKVPANHVLDQKPRAGTLIKSGRKMYLVLSVGVDGITVPNVQGMGIREAGLTLRARGLMMGRQSSMVVAGAEEAQILAQYPLADTTVSKGEPVNLLIAAPPPNTMRMPALVGRTLSAANKILQELGIDAVQVTRLYDPDHADSEVLNQEPGAGSHLERGRYQVTLGINQLQARFEANRYRLVFRTPPGLRPHNLRIELLDADGQKVIFRGLQQPQAEFSSEVQYNGPAQINIYLDDVFYQKFDLGTVGR